MKFTDGFWQMRPDVTPHYASQVHEVQVEPEALTIYAPTKKLNSRGDTLNLALLTIRYSSPMPNVIRVQIAHHKGALLKKPAFELKDQPQTKVEVKQDEKTAQLTSGQLSVRIQKMG